MEKLTGDTIGPDETWQEYADHSLTNDDVTCIAHLVIAPRGIPDGE